MVGVSTGLRENLKVQWRVNDEDITLNLHENNHVTSQVPVLTLKEHQLFLTICDFSKVSDIAKALESMEN